MSEKEKTDAERKAAHDRAMAFVDSAIKGAGLPAAPPNADEYNFEPLDTRTPPSAAAPPAKADEYSFEPLDTRTPAPTVDPSGLAPLAPNTIKVDPAAPPQTYQGDGGATIKVEALPPEPPGTPAAAATPPVRRPFGDRPLDVTPEQEAAPAAPVAPVVPPAAPAVPPPVQPPPPAAPAQDDYPRYVPLKSLEPLRQAPDAQSQHLAALETQAEEQALNESLRGPHYGIGEALRDTIPGALGALLDVKYNKGHGLGYIAAETAKNAGANQATEERQREASRKYALGALTARTRRSSGALGAQVEARQIDEWNYNHDPDSPGAIAFRGTLPENLRNSPAVRHQGLADMKADNPAYAGSFREGAAAGDEKITHDKALAEERGHNEGKVENESAATRQAGQKAEAAEMGQIHARLSQDFADAKIAEEQARAVGKVNGENIVGDTIDIPGAGKTDRRQAARSAGNPETLAKMETAIGSAAVVNHAFKRMKDIAARSNVWERNMNGDITGAYGVNAGAVIGALSDLYHSGVLSQPEYERYSNMITKLSASSLDFRPGARDRAIEAVRVELLTQANTKMMHQWGIRYNTPGETFGDIPAADPQSEPQPTAAPERAAPQPAPAPRRAIPQPSAAPQRPAGKIADDPAYKHFWEGTN